MKVSVDNLGRIVIPKKYRDELDKKIRRGIDEFQTTTRK